MSPQKTATFALAVVIALTAVTALRAPAAAAPLEEQAAADRAALSRATDQYEAARAAADAADARVAEVSAELDRLMAEEERARQRLMSRAVAIYRTDELSPLAILMHADDLTELTERFDLLERMSRQEAADLRTLKAAQAEAQRSAGSLLELQAEAARALDAMEAEVARARADLAASQAALAEYEARLAAAAAARAARPKAPAGNTPDQQLSGTGEWRTAVASHYSRNFTGRGANGEPIGPYTMMVAHKTLPFGTLVEFEYRGKRAVARVADRGPYTPGREFDLGPGVVRALDFSGVHEVRYRIISP